MSVTIRELIAQLSLRVRIYREFRKGISTTKKPFNERELLLLEFFSHWGECSFKKLNETLAGIPDSTLSNTIRKLHDKGFVKRESDPKDWRSSIVKLTASGRKLLEPLNEERLLVYTAIVDALELTDEEREIFPKILEKAIKNFDRQVGLADQKN